MLFFFLLKSHIIIAHAFFILRFTKIAPLVAGSSIHSQSYHMAGTYILSSLFKRFKSVYFT